MVYHLVRVLCIPLLLVVSCWAFQFKKETGSLVFPSNNQSTKELIKYLHGMAPKDDSQSAFARAAAIDILADRKEREAIPYLIECLADDRSLRGSDNWVGGHAANALSAITGKPFNLDQEKWKRWWKNQNNK